MGWVAESNCWLAEVGLESVEGWVMEGLQRVNTDSEAVPCLVLSM